MLWGLIFTFIIGLFFLMGILIYKFSSNKISMTIFASSCAFIVILGLILFDLVPELLASKNWYSIIFVLIGLFFLKIIDIFIPHHHHHHQDSDYETKKHREHLQHIGIITIIALIFHNFIEGIGLYSVTINNLKSGLMMLLGIGFHNVPLGIQIGAFNQEKRNITLTSGLVLSSFLGALVALMFGNIPEVMENIILALTLGMIFHILIFELLGELINNRGKKETNYGIIVGVIILIIINLL